MISGGGAGFGFNITPVKTNLPRLSFLGTKSTPERNTNGRVDLV
jgi:hypothetical protein